MTFGSSDSHLVFNFIHKREASLILKSSLWPLADFGYAFLREIIYTELQYVVVRICIPRPYGDVVAACSSKFITDLSYTQPHPPFVVLVLFKTQFGISESAEFLPND